ncbi:hypothetical protein HK105_200736 [Polyrhizophydium stewartii]|uniref:UV-stimulated scaffold protein A C-terminal domain-containing protein n=1 Tax=Polyrhizophydium stewartii TaxID=2732419 RepID=A0ABR4NK71_9FUNG
MQSGDAGLSQTISRLLTNGTDELNGRLLKEVKSSCKADAANVETAFKTVMKNMRRKHSQVRFACVQLCDQLFERSAVFRRLLVGGLGDFLELAIGKAAAGGDVGAAESTAAAAGDPALRSLFPAAFHCAPPAPGEQHGPSEQPAPPSLAATREVPAKARIKELRLDKYRKLREQFDDQSAGVVENLTKLRKCMDIMVPDFEQDAAGCSACADAGHVQPRARPADLYQDFVQSYGLGNLSYTLEITLSTDGLITETPETEPLFDTLRECTALLEKHMPQISLWIESITKADDPDKRAHEMFLKRVIDIKRSADDALSMARDLLRRSKREKRYEDPEQAGKAQSQPQPEDGFDFGAARFGGCDDEVGNQDDDDDDEEVFFEVAPANDASQTAPPGGQPCSDGDAPVERAKPTTPEQHGESEAAAREKEPASPQQDDGDDDDDVKPNRSHLDPETAKLLDQAPIVPYDDDLYFWDKSNITFSSISAHAGLDFHHRFLGDGPSDRTISDEALSGLRRRRVYLSSKLPTEIRPCRAPLPNGMLCPRRDLERCPVHGVIVERDETGTPLSTTDGEAAGSSDQLLPRSTARSRRDDRPAAAVQAWELIEGDVGRAHSLAPTRRKRASALVDIKKPGNQTIQRISKRIKKLTKGSAHSGDPDETEIEAKVRDRNLNRW